MAFESPAPFIDAKQYLDSKKTPKLKIFLGLLTILILVGGIIVSTKLVNIQQIFKSRASERSAQATDYDWQRLVGENWQVWIRSMQQLGIYPSIENGEITYYSYQGYKDRYCPDGNCIANPYSEEQMDQEFNYQDDFIEFIISNAISEGYSLKALEPYFPKIQETINIPGYIDDPRTKHDISEGELRDLITRIEPRYRYKDRDQFRALVTIPEIDFLTSSRALYNTSTGYEFTNTNDKINASLAILGFIPYSKVANLGRTAITESIKKFNYVKEAREITAFKSLLEAQGRLPATVFQAGFNAYQKTFQTRVPLPTKLVIDKSGHKPQPTTAGALEVFEHIREAVQNNWAMVVSKEEVLRPIAENLKRTAEDLEAHFGRKFSYDRSALDKLVDTGAVYVVPSKELAKIGGEHSGGFRNGDLIGVGYETQYDINAANHYFTHEFSHSMTATSPTNFNYSAIIDTTNPWDRFFTAIFELMTELHSDIAQGRIILSKGTFMVDETASIVVGGYGSRYTDVLEVFFNRFLKNNKDVLFEFIDFAMYHKDANRLVSAVVKNPDVDRYLRKRLGSQFNSTSDTDKFYTLITEGYGFNPAGALSPRGNTTALAGVAAAGLTVVPALELEASFIKDEYDHELIKDATIDITEVSGNSVPGGVIEVDSIYNQGGIYIVNPTEYETIWTIEPDVNQNTFNIVKTVFAQVAVVNPIQVLAGGENCTENCRVTIPANLPPGKYKLVANVVKKGTFEVVNSDSYPITVVSPNQGPKTIISLQIGGLNQDINNPQSVRFNVKDNPFVAAEVKYSDGSSKFVTLKFEAIPNQTQATTQPTGSGGCTVNCNMSPDGPGGVLPPIEAKPDQSTCAGIACAPANLTAVCADNNQIEFHWSDTIGGSNRHYWQFRVDDTSNPWYETTKDGDLSEDVQRSPVKMTYVSGHTYNWWMAGVVTDFTPSEYSKGAAHGPSITCPAPSLTPAPVSAQGTTPENGFAFQCHDIANSPTSANVSISWPAQADAKTYLIRLDYDPDSWSGSYNLNTEDLLSDRPSRLSIVNDRVTFGGPGNFSIRKGHLYKIWIHSALNDGPYENYSGLNSGHSFNSIYKGGVGPRIDGGTFICN